MRDDAGMLVRVLGPVDVYVGPHRVELRGRRESAIVAALAARLGEVVSAASLADVVWGTSPPRTASVQIQSCVGALRKRLGAAGVADPREVLATRHPGYLLVPTRVTTDLERFRQLVGEGRDAARHGDHERARASLRRGLELWRGDPFDDVTAVELATTNDRLVDERLTAVEDRVESDLAVGADAEVVADVTELVARHPLRERLRGQLMVALYRQGRRADALALYREGRRQLADELGLDPGDELSATHDRILRDDPALRRAPDPEPAARVRNGLPVPRQLPPDVATFVGRRRLVGDLAARLRPDPPSSAPAVVCLRGGGGVGKSTLAGHVAHLVRDSFPDGQLYVHLAGTAGPPADPAEVLAGLLRAFGFRDDELPAGVAERVTLFRSCLADRRVLVVLDDAADAAQVRPLLPSTPGNAVLVTSRPALTSLDGAHHTSVDTLDGAEALDLLRALLADAVDADPAAAEQVADLCGGLPLALRVAAARLTRAGGTSALDRFARRLTDEHRRLDLLETGDLAVRATLLLSWETLTDEQRVLLQRLSLLPASTFPEWVAAPLLDVDEDRGRDLVDDLEAAHLVGRVGTDPTGQATYRMHDLVRLVARERLESDEDAGTRRQVLGRLWHAWLGLTEAADALVPAQRAYVAGMTPEGAAPPLAAAAVTTDALGWFDAWHQHVIAVTSAALPDEPRTAALLAIRVFGFLSIRWATLTAAGMLADVADTEGLDADLRARLALQACTAHGNKDTAPADIRRHAEHAVEAARASGNASLELKARERLALSLWELADLDAALREVDALSAADAELDDRLRRQLRRLRGVILVDSGRVDEGLASLRDTFDIPNDDTLAVATDLLVYGRALSYLGYDEEAERQLRRSLELLARMEHTAHVAHLLLELAPVVANRGRADEAVELLRRADEILHTKLRGNDHDEAQLQLARGRVESIRGNLAAGVAMLEHVLAEYRRLREPRRANLVRRALVEAYRRAGDHDRAHTYLRQLPHPVSQSIR